MQKFAHLLDRLVLTPSRNSKLRLMVDYFAQTPDPDRGYALAAITRDLDIPGIKPAMLRNLITERMDDELFRLSYDYVGDLAETIALVWDGPEVAAGAQAKNEKEAHDPSNLTLGAIVERLLELGKTDAIRQLENWLDELDSSGRYALLKLGTGGRRIGVAARLAKVTRAEFGNVEVT